MFRYCLLSSVGIWLSLLHAQNVGIGTNQPQRPLHVYSSANPAYVRIQSSGAFGAAGIELVSDPIGSSTEWRPGFIRSGDNGNFTGRIDFYTNGTGAANRWGAVHVMSMVNGQVGIGTVTPHPGAKLHIVGNGTEGVILPRVALTAANSWGPLGGSPTDGMLVYNTATAGSGVNLVRPGYYYWQAGRWRRFAENGYAGLVQGVLATTQQDINTDAPQWQYLNAYIDLPPGRWMVFSTQLLRLPNHGVLQPHQSIWVRTTFSDNSTWSGVSPDIIGSPYISGILPPSCVFGIVTGQVLIHNQTTSTKRYYYFGHKQATGGTTENIRNVGTTLQAENQLFAIPAE
ncbi:MAG: hypothetical protein N2253_03470 [Bacteroidia bacterium]|nr:hypothetical protein [Bacteroidia bacterium]MCX7763939.1 hypothetical protein [Bacteroidia bacterium]MDW8057220.1 hypothetical protein [Bacteroidia bacterium]